MRVLGLDVRKVLAAFLVTFVTLTGGRIAAYHVQVKRPIETLLETRSDVAEWSLTRGGAPGDLEIRVKLKEVRNIQATYVDLCEDVQRAAGRRTFNLVVEDARTDELADTYQGMRLAVEEALARGTFREMAKAIAFQAREAGLERWGVYVDSANVYLQIHKDGRYLYEVIPRRDRLELRDPSVGGASVRTASWRAAS